MHIKKTDGYCIVTTSEGNTIKYRDIPEENIKKYNHDLPAGSNFNEWEKATSIELNCSFRVISEMADILEKSKIIFVVGFANVKGKHSIKIKPRALFTIDKFNNVLFDLSQKFNV